MLSFLLIITGFGPQQDGSKSTMADPFVQKFEELTMQRSFTFRTREATPLTWGQMKKLTQEAEKTLMKAGQPLNPTNLSLALMAVVTCQVICVSASNHTYWAYIPNPH